MFPLLEELEQINDRLGENENMFLFSYFNLVPRQQFSPKLLYRAKKKSNEVICKLDRDDR